MTSYTGSASPSESSTSLLLWFVGVWRTVPTYLSDHCTLHSGHRRQQPTPQSANEHQLTVYRAIDYNIGLDPALCPCPVRCGFVRYDWIKSVRWRDFTRAFVVHRCSRETCCRYCEIAMCNLRARYSHVYDRVIRKSRLRHGMWPVRVSKIPRKSTCRFPQGIIPYVFARHMWMVMGQKWQESVHCISHRTWSQSKRSITRCVELIKLYSEGFSRFASPPDIPIDYWNTTAQTITKSLLRLDWNCFLRSKNIMEVVPHTSSNYRNWKPD